MTVFTSMTSKAGDSLRRLIPASRRRKIAWIRLRLRVPTARFRVLPGFIIIGAQRAGTSSMYRYLGNHPDVVPSLRKETEYFSYYYARGENWYRAHFPLAARMFAHRLVTHRPAIAFEATPEYLLDPRAAGRAAQLVPNAKIIVLLRNPVDRAFSHHSHMTRLGYETVPFDEAIEEEEARIAEARERVLVDETYVSSEFRRFSYLERGRYAEQLQRWFDCFEQNRILVIKSEDMFQDPGSVLGNVLEFLGLAEWHPKSFGNYSYSTVEDRPPQPVMTASTRVTLSNHFAQMNQELEALIGRSMGWDRPVAGGQ